LADRWAPFLVMTGVEIVRSMVFFGVNTFIELYWIHHLGASRGLAGAALACFLLGGLAGTLLGGRIADRMGLVRALQAGTVVMIPALIALRLCPGPGLALAAAAASGAAVNIPFSVMIKLGQDYLPSRPVPRDAVQADGTIADPAIRAALTEVLAALARSASVS
jgi:MFS transporter, FSR family, fosmidomycin resistance protein